MSSAVTTGNATTSGTGAPTAASGGVKSTPATLVVSMRASSPEMDKIMSGQVSKYGTTDPGVKATPLTITGGPYDQKLLTMIAGGQAPDVIEINPDLFADYASRNVMHNLEPFMKLDKSFDINAYLPQQVAGFRWQGALGGLPIYNFTFVVYYNKDLFDKAGGACFCVSATTKQRDDAWNVTKWLVGEETQLAWVGTRLFAPTLIKVANSPQWADPSNAPANIKAFTDMTAHSRFIAVNYPAEAERNTALTSAFDTVWLGKQTAKTAAAAAAGPVQKLITTAAAKRSSRLS